MNISSFKKSILACVVALLLTTVNVHAQVKHKYVVIEYVGGYKGVADMGIVNPGKLTHINYAFVNVRNDRAWLAHERTDTINFRNLVLLKKKNPALKILISIGGWNGYRFGLEWIGYESLSARLGWWI